MDLCSTKNAALGRNHVRSRPLRNVIGEMLESPIRDEVHAGTSGETVGRARSKEAHDVNGGRRSSGANDFTGTARSFDNGSVDASRST